MESPVRLVSKKMDASGEKYRMVIEFRKFNETTIDDKYPLPNIYDLFNKLGESTTLELANVYHQINKNDLDSQKTAFSIKNGYRIPKNAVCAKNWPSYITEDNATR